MRALVISLMHCLLILGFASTSALAQQSGFKFGATYKNLNFVPSARDSAAEAIVLQEFGDASFDPNDGTSIVFEYHVRIKILKKSGLKFADVEIPLYKWETDEEELLEIKASAFNIENGSLKETPLDGKQVLTEDFNKNFTIKKFAIPNVRAGSVIEYFYKTKSPYIFNFKSWNFQGEIPKLSSEYWASIPGNYLYHISLSGYLKLAKNESARVPQCYTYGRHKADCSLFKYAMNDVPAFQEEDYMTAKSNHIAAINFELAEIKAFDGMADKITKEWKDADEELKKHPSFGYQLRKGKDIEEFIKPLIQGETDPLKKAKKVYNFIREWYRWNGTMGKYSEHGIRKAFDSRVGNVGDINLSLIAALDFAGIDVDPVILSTRDNGLPIDIYPVISDFNYVVARANIGGKSYFADATEDFVPFGVLPIRCINGKGRVLDDSESFWAPLTPDRAKSNTVINLILGEDGIMRGTILTTLFGYDAIDKRTELSGYSSMDEYFKKLGDENRFLKIVGSSLTNLDSIDKSLSQKLDVEIDLLLSSTAANFLFNPFVVKQRWTENPFKSTERLYPIDFGTPIESTVVMSLQYPSSFELIDAPEKIALALPNKGGRFIYSVQNSDGKVILNSTLAISATVYPADEYHHLRELFSRVIQSYNQDLLFRRKG